MKQLYAARSSVVHAGVLPSNSRVDIADTLVNRATQAILERGRFLDWISLTLGVS